MGFWSSLFGGGSGVTFVRKYSQEKRTPMGETFTCHYEIYKASTAQEARTFLEGKTVTEPQRYIIVETPQGNWAKDKDSMYKE